MRVVISSWGKWSLAAEDGIPIPKERDRIGKGQGREKRESDANFHDPPQDQCIEYELRELTPPLSKSTTTVSLSSALSKFVRSYYPSKRSLLSMCLTLRLFRPRKCVSLNN
jgi:hypothetical protein